MVTAMAWRPAVLTGQSGPVEDETYWILVTWLNERVTGVSRSKMETSTTSCWDSGLISEIVAGRVSNGPSLTVTDSPTSKSTTAA